MKTIFSRRGICRVFYIGCFVVGCAASASADVIHQAVSYPPDSVGGWSSIDFDGDTVPELSFEFYGIGHESGGVWYLNVHGSQDTEVLMESGHAVPLHEGDAISLAPVMGQWQATGIQSYVWSLGFSSSPENSPPTPGQGIGMPGYGDFMGVRFLDGGDWHYGWVRFGPFDSTSSQLPVPNWPSVLEFAYESFPNTPIVVPEPFACALLLSGGFLFWLYGRRK